MLVREQIFYDCEEVNGKWRPVKKRRKMVVGVEAAVAPDASLAEAAAILAAKLEENAGCKRVVVDVPGRVVR